MPQNTISTTISGKIFDLGLSAREFALFCLIKRECDQHGDCHRSMEWLAENSRLSYRTVSNLKHILSCKGIIHVVKNRKSANGADLADLITICKEFI